MKCPYRKITYHRPEGRMNPARDEEGFAECYGKECPYYNEGFVHEYTRKTVQNEPAIL